MHYNRPCGCKGVRTCLICEKEYDLKPSSFLSLEEKRKFYFYCYLCGKAWESGDPNVEKQCPNHNGRHLTINGVFILPDFINEEEREKLLQEINKENWEISQSGRRKQNYGPKCNFKKNKIQIGNFKGFPSYSKFIHDKFKLLPILENYRVIEQCTLEYDPARGSSIDPHIDDCWIWGERIITLNVLGSTFLTMTKYTGDKKKYNLNQVETYPCILDSNGCILKDCEYNKSFQLFDNCNEESENPKVTVKIKMPEKSLIVLYGSARYEWEHFVLRDDITHLRICLAFREFTPPYLPKGAKEEVSSSILSMASNYW